MWKIIDKLGLFFVNFFNAVKFAAFDYDVSLRRTKTPRQRLIIWGIIFSIAFIVCYFILFFLGRITQAIIKNRTIKLIDNGI